MMRRLFLLPLMAMALSSCQQVFTTSGAWSRQPLPPASTAGSDVVGTVDGRVVVLGGQSQTGDPVGQTLVLNPGASQWTQAAPIPEPRSGDVAVPLADGTVLVAAGAGGNRVQNQLYRSTWIFEPARNRWSRAGDLHTARTYPNAVRLTDGRVLLAAGSAGGDQQPLASAETYDPSTRAWSEAGDLSLARTGVALAALPGGAAVAVGGCLYQQNQGGVPASAATEIFIPGTSSWTSARALPEARCSANAVGLADGRVLLVGGIVNQPNGFGTSPTALLFDSRTGEWASAGNALASGAILAGPGGIAPPAAPVLLRDASVFQPVVQSGPVRGHVSTAIVGGQLFNPSTSNWTFATSTAVDLASQFGEPAPVPVALPSGRVLVLLDTIALGFDPQGQPPARQALDNLSLTWLLLGLNGVLLVLLALGLLLGRRGESRAMARL
jgi:Galactose oxidase, central domain/Kelch motif